MGKMMITLRSAHSVPTLGEIEQQFGLSSNEVDQQFGVVEVDDLTHDYTILVEENAVPRIHSTEQWTVSGPYSNPSISTFGPPDINSV